MLLETGGEDIRFKPRILEGVPLDRENVKPNTLILDGQQRLTSLYQALKGVKPVETKDTKGKPIKRWYYIDIKKILTNENNRDEAIVSVPEDKLIKAFGGEIILDLTNPEQEYKNYYFPVNKIFNASEWRLSYEAYWNYETDKILLYNKFESEIIKRFEQYYIPVIELKRETPKEAVCLVFERVNTGGIALNVFALLTAAFAADGYQLREDWESRERHMKQKFDVLMNLQNDDFLQAISLLNTKEKRDEAIRQGIYPDKAPGISCKRRDILKLNVNDWKKWSDNVEKGFEKVARFLYNQKIFKARDLPYRTQLVPLAAILTELNIDTENEGVRKKIAQWYWCGVLGELYGGANETRFARDLPEVVNWIRNKQLELPITIQEANFQPRRLITLRTRNSAAYKGIYALLMKMGCLDFRTGQPIEEQTFFDDKIDIHHIFPEKWCNENNIPPAFYESIINKTAISARTNRIISGKAPSQYLIDLQQKEDIGAERMNDILHSHYIEPEHIRSDDFWNFYQSRAEKLINLIAEAMQKPIKFDTGLFNPQAKLEMTDEKFEEKQAEFYDDQNLH